MTQSKNLPLASPRLCVDILSSDFFEKQNLRAYEVADFE